MSKLNVGVNFSGQVSQRFSGQVSQLFCSESTENLNEETLLGKYWVRKWGHRGEVTYAKFRPSLWQRSRWNPGLVGPYLLPSPY